MPRRVLLADTDKELLQMFDELLTLGDLEIITATTGPQCLAAFRQFQPEVLVLELDLPDSWSNRLLTMMRTGLDVPCVPTVILSRFIEERTNYLDWPMVKQFLVKPVSIARLTESIRAAI